MCFGAFLSAVPETAQRGTQFHQGVIAACRPRNVVGLSALALARIDRIASAIWAAIAGQCSNELGHTSLAIGAMQPWPSAAVIASGPSRRSERYPMKEGNKCRLTRSFWRPAGSLDDGMGLSLYRRVPRRLPDPALDVRFALVSRHCQLDQPCPFCAMNGLMHRSKQQLYSITGSARANSVGGTSRPSALAVLKFTTSSNR